MLHFDRDPSFESNIIVGNRNNITINSIQQPFSLEQNHCFFAIKNTCCQENFHLPASTLYFVRKRQDQYLQIVFLGIKTKQNVSIVKLNINNVLFCARSKDEKTKNYLDATRDFFWWIKRFLSCSSLTKYPKLAVFVNALASKRCLKKTLRRV